MTARDTLQYLSNIGMSPHYMKPISLYKNFQSAPHCKIEYESLSNLIEILPPSVWFTVDQQECLTKIRNDVEKSRVTREGYLITNVMGNCLNQINYQSFDEDIGVIQQNQHCLCVPFSVVKDDCQQILKYIHKELRVFHQSSLINKVKRSYMNSQYLDDISQFIYSKFRTFLIFQAKMQSARVPILQSCYYPNVNFIVERIKTKQNPKFLTNQILSQIKDGNLKNTFGYLALDNKRRILVLKRDEPDMDFETECFIGVWVSSILPLHRTEKKFGKKDSIWCAIYEFYTNKQLKNKIRLTNKNRGFLAYFPPILPNKPKFSPEYYLFEPDNKISIPKWCFMLKQETLTDWKKNLEIKFDFLNNTIMEEREYSQFSDATNNEGLHKMESGPKEAISDAYLSNNTTQQQSNQTSFSRGSINSSSGEDKERQKNKDRQKIQQLQKELDHYKKRCLQLETMNNILLSQQKNLYSQPQPQYHINGGMPFQHPVPQYYHPQMAYGQPMGMNPFYPLSHSQVSNNSANVNPPFLETQSQKNKNDSEKTLINQQKQTNPLYCFPTNKEEEITFGTKNQQAEEKEQGEIEEPSNSMFMKKKSSSGPNNNTKKDAQILKQNSASIREIFVKPDARNISFQDSFAEYHQQGEGEQFQNEEAGYEEEQFVEQEIKESLRQPQQSQKIKKQQEQDIKPQRVKKYLSMEQNYGFQSGQKNRSKNQLKQQQEEQEEDRDDHAYTRSPEFRRFESMPQNSNRSSEQQQSPRTHKFNQKDPSEKETPPKQTESNNKNNTSFDFQQFLAKYKVTKTQFESERQPTNKESNKPNEYASSKAMEQFKQKTQQRSTTKYEVDQKNDSEDSDEDVQLKNILNRYKC